MATHSNGIAALQLQNQLGIGSYRSAWLLAAKLRKAMVDPERDPLSGLIEVDETALAFRTKNDPVAGGAGRSHDGKLLVVGAVEVGVRRAACAWPRSRPTAPASTASRPQHRRRQHRQDRRLGRLRRGPRRAHDPHVIGSMAAHLVCPGSIRCSPIKGWARGVYHGLRAKHLQSYLASSCSASTGAGHATPPSARCSASPCGRQHVGPAGSWCISDSPRSRARWRWLVRHPRRR